MLYEGWGGVGEGGRVGSKVNLSSSTEKENDSAVGWWEVSISSARHDIKRSASGGFGLS